MFKRWPSLTTQIILAMLLGALCGDLFGTQVAFLGVLGKLVIQLIKAVALPLVFFAIVEALISTHIPAKKGLHLILITGINACFAATIGLLLSNTFHSGKDLKDRIDLAIPSSGELELQTHGMDFSKVLSGYIPDSILAPFVQNNLIAVVLLALLIGIAARAVERDSSNQQSQARPLLSAAKLAYGLFEKMIVWLVHLVPLAVFGAMAKTVGQYGFTPFSSLLFYVLIAIVGMGLQIVLVYSFWIKFVSARSLNEFAKIALRPVVYAFGTNSSLATLPLTLKALDNFGISHASSRLGACVGTNLNNDGILLYEAMSVLFVAQAYGIELGLQQQIAVALLSLVAAIGVAGIPEAGIVSLSLVLSTVGLPLEILPLLLTVDWLIARMRSVTNVLSDMTVSVALDGLDRKVIS